MELIPKPLSQTQRTDRNQWNWYRNHCLKHNVLTVINGTGIETSVLSTTYRQEINVTGSKTIILSTKLTDSTGIGNETVALSSYALTQDSRTSGNTLRTGWKPETGNETSCPLSTANRFQSGDRSRLALMQSSVVDWAQSTN